MSRTIKGTRSKYLPPKIQLVQNDAVTGSYPTINRVSSDNRTGKYTKFFDDTNTINFKSEEVVITPITYSDPGRGFDANIDYNSTITYSTGTLIFWLRNEETILSPSAGEYSLIDYCNSGAHSEVTGGVQLFSAFDGQIPSIVNDKPSFYVDGTVIRNENSLYINAIPTNASDTTKRYVNNRFSEDITKTFFSSSGGALDWSFACHLKFTSLSGVDGINPIMYRGDETSEEPDYQIWAQDDGRIYAGVFNGSKFIIWRTNNQVLNLNEWCHVGVTIKGNGGNTKFYINGSEVSNSIHLAQGTWIGYPNAPNNPIYLGVTFDKNYLGVNYSGYDFGSGNTNNFYSNFYIDNVVMFRELAGGNMEALANGGPLPDAVAGVPEIRNGGIQMPLGLPPGHSLLRESTEFSTSLGTVNGIVRKGVADTFVHFTPGQDIRPFNDHANPASDNKNNSFYATGSAATIVGEGFDNPLWSKTKFEIDLTPSTQHEFYIQNNTASSSNYVMAYWNNDSKRYQGIGNGIEFEEYVTSTSTSSMKQFLDEVPIGFGMSLDNGGVPSTSTNFKSRILGLPITNFGFPIHPKFHATSSNLVEVSNYINEPFLLEKVVLYTSASFNLNDYSTADSTNNVINTFFILNQRKPIRLTGDQTIQEITYFSGSTTSSSFITSSQIPTTYNGTYVDTVRDLVTYIQISRDPNARTEVGPEYEIFDINSYRDYTITDRTWSQQFVISSSVKSPIAFSQGLPMKMQAFIPEKSCEIIEKYNFSGRKGIEEVNGRDFLSSFSYPEIVGTASISSQWADAGFYDVQVNAQTAKANPYILMPGDKLIFGWQLPTSQTSFNKASGGGEVFNGKGPALEFGPTGIHKIVFYGSLMSEGKEKHDTLNQLLTSQTIHEVIG